MNWARNSDSKTHAEKSKPASRTDSSSKRYGTFFWVTLYIANSASPNSSLILTHHPSVVTIMTFHLFSTWWCFQPYTPYQETLRKMDSRWFHGWKMSTGIVVNLPGFRQIQSSRFILKVKAHDTVPVFQLFHYNAMCSVDGWMAGCPLRLGGMKPWTLFSKGYSLASSPSTKPY